MGKQLKALRQKSHIIIATPGRLIDHLESKTVDLSSVGILVLDEADRMLDMGFAPQVNKILQRVPIHRQTMLFSATMPDEIVKIARSYMSLPLRVEVAPPGTAVKTVTHEVFFVERQEKNAILRSILVNYKGSVLIFCRTKHGARKVTASVRDMGHTAAEIHSNRSLKQRIEALEGFKIGKYRVLVATDIAARGIDVSGIELVINYDMPATAEDYVHRIGRTARAGLSGHAISFAQPDQKREIRNIERLIRKPLPISTSSLPKQEYRQISSKPFESERPRLNFRNQGQWKKHRKSNRGQGGSFYGGRKPQQRSGGYFMQSRGNRSDE